MTKKAKKGKKKKNAVTSKHPLHSSALPMSSAVNSTGCSLEDPTAKFHSCLSHWCCRWTKILSTNAKEKNTFPLVKGERFESGVLSQIKHLHMGV